MKKVRSHPWIAKEVPVRGFVFDVETGLITGSPGRLRRRLLPEEWCAPSIGSRCT